VSQKNPKGMRNQAKTSAQKNYCASRISLRGCACFKGLGGTCVIVAAAMADRRRCYPVVLPSAGTAVVLARGPKTADQAFSGCSESCWRGAVFAGYGVGVEQVPLQC
jgi:hypothetical protein